jgi:ornithine cyclodeaminase
MEEPVYLSDGFIEKNTDFLDLVKALQNGFAAQDILVPQRHHHDFPNPKTSSESTLLLMSAWYPGKEAGVKIATVSPENNRFGLPAVQAIYVLMNAVTGEVKAMLQAKSLTAKRTAATSALASSFLSKESSSSLLMIGTGALSINLIRAHAAVRPIKEVYVWGRNLEKAKQICSKLQRETYNCQIATTIEEIIGKVDIVSCATLSKKPLVFGKHLRAGQHIDLIGAYKKDMREADDEVITRSSVFVDTLDGLHESGDIAIPMANGILSKETIQGNLFSLCQEQAKGRTHDGQITVFKSVGHALEDLVAASYYFKKFKNE